MQAAAQTQAIRPALEEETVCAREFLELLLEERNALVGGDVEKVARYAHEKLVLAERLQHQAEQREQIRSGILERNGADPLKTDCADAWLQLRTILEQANDHNRVNWLLVSSRLATVNNAIGVLHGTEDASSLYHKDGYTQASRTVAAGAPRWSA